MYLLQQDIQFFAEPDPRSTLITVIVFAMLVIVGIVAAAINARRGGRSGRAGRAGGSFKRDARRLGLTAEQTSVLVALVKSLTLQNPERLFSNDAYMNHALRKRIEQLDMAQIPDDTRELEKSQLFQIKRILQNSHLQLRVLPSTRHIRVGQAVTIQAKDGPRYDSEVRVNVHNGFGVEVPFDRRTGRVTWPKGQVVGVTAVVDPDRLFAFTSRVIAYNNAKGASIMFLEHVTNVKQRQKRRSPRREYDRPCYFYPVAVYTVGRGRRAKTQAFVNKNKRSFGRFEDLSAGGCAIRTQASLTADSYLRVDFETSDGSKISAFGRVRSVDRRLGRGALMHIMFTRVSRKNLNKIQGYVYGVAGE